MAVTISTLGIVVVIDGRALAISASGRRIVLQLFCLMLSLLLLFDDDVDDDKATTRSETACRRPSSACRRKTLLLLVVRLVLLVAILFGYLENAATMVANQRPCCIILINVINKWLDSRNGWSDCKIGNVLVA